ncbi:MAG: glutamate synthase subunit alpha, partial [Chitinivibrionales bacterium]|nr:glutamate synthase subunit alpha [Chitinivibrionales bacterium]
MKQPTLYDPWYEHDACGVGFVVNMKGTRTHGIVDDGIRILCNLEHRGAKGGDQKTGDGAGMLLQMPHRFFSKTVSFALPDEGSYGVGFFFLDPDPQQAEKGRALIERAVGDERGTVLGWREVPVCPECLGEFARKAMPSFWQVFVTFPALSGIELERKLYVVRKCCERAALEQGWDWEQFYATSFSSRVITYKGMFVSEQFATFYPDLADKDFESCVALVHQRYSTNTFPSWPNAQPF